MSTVAAFRPPPSPEELSEKEVRVQLAACYRLVAHFGMDDLVFTHISARVPGTNDHFFINPYGCISARSPPRAWSRSISTATSSRTATTGQPGRFRHSQRGPCGASRCRMRAPHPTRAGVAVSCLAEGLLPLNQFSLQFFNRIGYHDYEGVALDLDERQRLVADLGDKRILVLRNHGLLTAGRTIPRHSR